MEIYVRLPKHLEDKVDIGELLFASGVVAANVIRDFKETIRNYLGGNMESYEELIEKAVKRAIENLVKKAKEKGYNGLTEFRISNPTVVEGGAEVIVYANGFRFRNISGEKGG